MNEPDAVQPALPGYREGRYDDPFREKGWWVAAAAALMAGLALFQQAVNVVIYLFPDAFATVSSGLRRDGTTDWGMTAVTVASSGISLVMFLAAVLYLRGRDTRGALVRIAVLHIVFSLSMSSYVQFKLFRDASLPDQAVHIAWLIGSMVQDALVPGIVAVFFHRPRARPRGSLTPSL
jgi:hypothetical protein